jgi:hypothetical protein
MYTIVKNELGVEWIVRDNGDDTISWIPIDEANSDYVVYLNKDKAEQSTPIVKDEPAAKK